QPLMTSAQVIVDPVMADKGKLYRGFDVSYPQVMKNLVHKANILLPNITEACLLTDTPYLGDDYTLEQVDQLVDKLHALGPERVILTGISFDSQQIGFYASDKSSRIYVSHERFQEDFYGTGDLSTALISSLLIKGVNVQETLEFTVKWMHTILERSLASGKPIKYGLSIEPLLIDLGLAMRELCNV
ncbi:MAG: bifunctional hydroxymethylpyrimidine kinase/phosphomethylpyrimidine kinase, partial [Latilactobacillus curvatus]